MTMEELEQQLAAANARADDLERDNKRLDAQAQRSWDERQQATARAEAAEADLIAAKAWAERAEKERDYHERKYLEWTVAEAQQRERAEAAERERDELAATVKRQMAWTTAGLHGKADDDRANADKLVAIDAMVTGLEADRDEAVGLLRRAKGWADASHMGHNPAWFYEAAALLARLPSATEGS